MTMKVRDEEDVIDANLRFHLAAGVDFFIVTDNGSVDGTPAILERWEQAGLARVLRDEGEGFYRRNEDWVTRMARMAAAEHGADWVINNDADEFWWPLEGDLKAAFAAVPERFAALSAPRPEFVAGPDGDTPFYERMTLRERASSVRPKLAHRASEEVVAGGGGHRVIIPGRGGPAHQGRALLRPGGERSEAGGDWVTPAPQWPVRIMHFPIRSSAQYARRIEIARASGRYQDDARATQLFDRLDRGEVAELYAEQQLSEEASAKRLAEGTLVEDARLRDTLRALPDLPASAATIEEARRGFQPEASRQGAEELAEDGMRALLRSEEIAAERLATARAQTRRLKKRVKRLRRRRKRLEARVEQLESTPLNRAARVIGARLSRRKKPDGQG